MSKKAKAKAKQDRLAEKRKRKAIERAKYESYRNQGINTKSRRARKTTAVNKNISVKKHRVNCGNNGCRKCYKVNFSPFLKHGKPVGMPNWMYRLWKKENG